MALCLAKTDGVALVTEYIPGTALSEVVRGGARLTEDALQVIVAQLVCALGVCHEAGVLHRDLKPANIMVDSRTGHPKLIDFGLSSRLQRPEWNSIPLSEHGGTLAEARTGDAANKGSAASRKRKQKALLQRTHKSSRSA